MYSLTYSLVYSLTFFQRFRKLRIQEGHFLKIALNLDLTLPDDGECPAFLISCGIIKLGVFCVELWSFFVSERNSVPMSYITCLDVCAKNKISADTCFNTAFLLRQQIHW